MKKITLLLMIIAGLLFSSFIVIPVANFSNINYEIKELNQVIELGKAQFVKALINIKGGKVLINSDTKNLATVDFKYIDEHWNPNVSYTENNTEGKLIVKSNARVIKDKEMEENSCKIALNKDLTYSLGIDIGIGIAEVNLEGYHIDKALLKLGVGSFNFNFANTSIPLLKVEAGIGEAVFDFSGKWNNDLNAIIKAGIGEVEFIVPTDVGVRFKINGFLGDVDAKGFRKTGKIYENKAYNNAQFKLEFDVSGAIGSITVTHK